MNSNLDGTMMQTYMNETFTRPRNSAHSSWLYRGL